MNRICFIFPDNQRYGAELEIICPGSSGVAMLGIATLAGLHYSLWVTQNAGLLGLKQQLCLATPLTSRVNPSHRTLHHPTATILAVQPW